MPGGFCSLLLADFGADVIKVEDTGMGDYVRADPPAFHALNRGKRAVSIDLKNPAGRDAFVRMAGGADVVLESFRPGVMERLGVGYERLREENPRLVYCAITGYGQDSAYAQRAGHDMNYLALAGLLGLTGERDGAPIQAAGQIADLGGGALMAAFGILAALRERDASGEGQFVDISMKDGALSWLAMDAARVLAGTAVPGRGETPLAGGLICYRPYRCADGWVTFGALEPKFWQAWCHGVGRARSRRAPVRARRVRCAPRGRGGVHADGPATSGRRSTTSTTAASSRCWRSTKRSSAPATWSCTPAPSACSARRCGCRARRRTRPARPGRRAGPTPTRCSPRRASRPDEIGALREAGAVA